MSRSRILRKTASFGAMPRMPAARSSAPSMMHVAQGIHSMPTTPMAAHMPLVSAGRLPYVQGYSVVNLLRQPGLNNPAFVGAPQDPTAPSSTNYVPPVTPDAAATPAAAATPDSGAAPPATDDGSGGTDQSQYVDQTPPQDGTTYANGYTDDGSQPDGYGGYAPQYQQGGWYGYSPDNGWGAPQQAQGDGSIPDPTADPGVTDANYYGDPEVLPPRSNPFPLVNSHVRNGYLRTMAILNTPDGMIPLTTAVPIFGAEVYDGYVRFGANVQPPGVDGAVMTTRKKLLADATREQVRMQCESLVRRARQGDQNATAILAEMASNAKKGDPRAKLAYSFARTYIQRNPAGADVGAEGAPNPKRLSYWTAVTLANGAPLTNQRLASLAGSFPRPEDVQVFLHGFANYNDSARLSAVTKQLDDYKQKVLDLGRTVGEARALQMARHPAVPLKAYDKAIAWEFGE